MNRGYQSSAYDQGPCPYTANVENLAARNQNFRTAVWTGCYVQMTLMCIPKCGDIGLEVHEETDQIIRIEQGNALVKMGQCSKHQDFEQNLRKGDVVFIPAGTWHNIINIGSIPLKLSSVYAPPNHPKGTVDRTKEEGH